MKRLKKCILIFVFLLPLFLKGQISMYHLMPDSSALWNFQVLSYTGVVPVPNYSVTISGDTLINSQVYHKLENIFPRGYKGAFRENISIRKVFFLPPTDSIEQMLYDFSMQVGDTVKGYLERANIMTDTVISIDSVMVGSSYRKRWIINTCYDIQLIEGVGLTYGLIESSPGCQLDGFAYSLTCFSKNNNSLYPDTVASCQPLTGVFNKETVELSVYPNPSNGSITLSFGQSNEFTEIYISDLIGRVVFHKMVNGENVVRIEDLPQGVLTLSVMDRNKRTINRKLIISNH